VRQRRRSGRCLHSVFCKVSRQRPAWSFPTRWRLISFAVRSSHRFPDCWASRGGSLRSWRRPLVDSWFNTYLGGSFLLASPFMAGSIGALAFLRLPETLPIDRRVPFHPAGAGKVLFAALANIRFVAYTAVFGLIASAQLVFGVVAPFLYQQNLGLSAGAYGLIALLIGGANLAGEVACTSLATRTSLLRCPIGLPSRDASSSAQRSASGRIVLPHHLGRHAGPRRMRNPLPDHVWNGAWTFSRNLGLLGGFISSLCYLAVSMTMALAAYLPETSQAPLGWVYLAIGTIAALLLGTSLPGEETSSSHS
jgi:MFS transporter, DHA1 family, multidrug resistance protein